MAREKVTELANRIMLEGGDGDSTGLSNSMNAPNQQQLSRQERELLVQNDQLNRAARQGKHTEDVAISTKVNLAGQTDQVMRINQQVVELRNKDIKGGNKLVDDIEHVRRKNLCILFSIGTMLVLALLYIIWSNLNKHLGSEKE